MSGLSAVVAREYAAAFESDALAAWARAVLLRSKQFAAGIVLGVAAVFYPKQEGDEPERQTTGEET